jgi:Spy/CpxP family protein refolding chaperone
MPSRCKRRVGTLETNSSPCDSILKVFSKIVPQIDYAVFRRLLTLSVCFGASSLFLTTSPSLALDSNDGKLKPKNKVLISENSNYDGASLPPPVKKKNQVTVGGDDAQDDVSARRNRRRRIADVDTDPMSTPDTAGGVSVPAKKVQKSADLPSGKGPGDRDFRPGGPGGPDRKGRRDRDPLFGRGPLDLTPLGLTDDQKQKIAQMHTENATKMRDLLKKRHELSGQMKDTMLGADVTETQIKAKRDEVRQVQEKLEDLRLNDFLAIRALLTPEQKLKLKDVKIVEGRPREGDGPPGQPPPRRADGDTKRLADTPINK